MVIQIDNNVLENVTDINVLSTLHLILSKVIQGIHDLYIDDVESYRSEQLKEYRELIEKRYKAEWQGRPLQQPDRLVRVVLPEDIEKHATHSSREQDLVLVPVQNQRVSISRGKRRLEIISL